MKSFQIQSRDLMNSWRIESIKKQHETSLRTKKIETLKILRNTFGKK